MKGFIKASITVTALLCVLALTAAPAMAAKGDFARCSFVRSRNFSRVIAQQGGVLVDSDFNGQEAPLSSWNEALPFFGSEQKVGSSRPSCEYCSHLKPRKI